MTGKMLTSPLLPPDLVDGVNRSKFNFFFRTAPTQTNKDICTETTCADSGFFCQGEGGLGSSTYFTVYIGVQWFYYTFSRGGPTFSRRVQMLISIETHIHATITCDFPGGSGPLSTSGSANVQYGILARIGSDESVRPPFKLRNSKC